MKKEYHNVTFRASNGIHIELHFTLLEKPLFPKAQGILETVWDDVVLMQEGGMQMQMSDELYYFYHILHMASHLCSGGCGIRPFLDLWILDHAAEDKNQRRNTLLAEGSLLTFADAARQLTSVWFAGHDHTPVTHQMAKFILRGGTYGTVKSRTTVRQVQQGGKIRWLLSKIFLNYDLLKVHYPILEHHKWLVPFCQVARWFWFLRDNRWKKVIPELKANATISNDAYNATEDLLKQLGLLECGNTSVSAKNEV